MGLRERKKEQTRQRLAETAHRLFIERGFDGVTVAEIAREAEVAEATLFNYFPTKEALFFSGLEAFGARLVEAVRDRSAGEPALAAFRAFVLGTGGRLDRIAEGDLATLDQMRTTARVIAASAALRGREQQVHAGIAAALAGALTAEHEGAADHDRGAAEHAAGGDLPVDPVPRAVANALLGVHTALVDYSRHRLLADDRPAEIAADVRAYGERAFALLEHGLGVTYPARR
ncbi:MAG: TetR/AcrR family transcriptional regulator [Pseudonocardia sp.]|nr:TetR/AcrR family transcriptional regulator [Pseudonocardia sp.]